MKLLIRLMKYVQESVRTRTDLIIQLITLRVSSENLTKSLSTMIDTDMSEEMTTYTSETVLTQAATSILAQANERPSQVLQLLQ